MPLGIAGLSRVLFPEDDVVAVAVKENDKRKRNYSNNKAESHRSVFDSFLSVPSDKNIGTSVTNAAIDKSCERGCNFENDFGDSPVIISPPKMNVGINQSRSQVLDLEPLDSLASLSIHDEDNNAGVDYTSKARKSSSLFHLSDKKSSTRNYSINRRIRESGDNIVSRKIAENGGVLGILVDTSRSSLNAMNRPRKNKSCKASIEKST